MSRMKSARHAVAVPAVLGALVTTLTVGLPSSAHADEPAPAPATGLTPAFTPSAHSTARTYRIAERVTFTSSAVAPVSGYRLTGEFGDVSGLWSTVHTGLDFATAEGSPIYAVQNGVLSTGYDGAYGNKTVLRLDDGTELWFCHQSAFDVSVGQSVSAGEVIGYVGSTGNVTGPHLHLEVRPGGGDPVDPYAALAALGVQV